LVFRAFPTRHLHDSKLTPTKAEFSIDVGVLTEVPCYVPPFCGDRFWTEKRFLMIPKLTVNRQNNDDIEDKCETRTTDYRSV
jgi:hypothetical protein